jgi:hypothetical protein
MTDYIEREKAFDAVFGQFCASSDETETALNAAIEEIRAIPAADVTPVVHGRWIDTDNYFQRWKCSACGCHTRDAAPNFCSNCGAKMDKEGADYD